MLIEFDPTTNSFASITPPPDGGGPYPVSYLNLPTGQVMTTGGSRDWLYTPDSPPQDAWRPAVTSVTYNSSTSMYTLTGTQLSGLINGGDEGDDMTMAENYPIVWLKDASNNVYYCRSSNFSTMGPQVGTRPQTCQFTTPANLPERLVQPLRLVGRRAVQECVSVHRRRRRHRHGRRQRHRRQRPVRAARSGTGGTPGSGKARHRRSARQRWPRWIGRQAGHRWRDGQRRHRQRRNDRRNRNRWYGNRRRRPGSGGASTGGATGSGGHRPWRRRPAAGGNGGLAPEAASETGQRAARRRQAGVTPAAAARRRQARRARRAHLPRRSASAPWR